MWDFIHGTAIGCEKVLFFCAIGLIVEYLLPAEREQPAASIIFNFVWIVIFITMTNALMLVFGNYGPIGIAALHGPLFTIHFPAGIFGGICQFLLLMFMHDFLYYCFHRCQHTWGWFWAHHKFHHTDEHMNASTSFRHHWLENIYRIPFIVIPLGLVNVDGSYTALVWDAGLFWAIFTHMNLRLHMGPLTRIFAGPQVHRIHHSCLPEHKNRNFSAFFPIYDIVFGTYHHPGKNEFPACGISPREVTSSLWQANFGVFRDWYGMSRRFVFKLRGRGRTASSVDIPN